MRCRYKTKKRIKMKMMKTRSASTKIKFSEAVRTSKMRSKSMVSNRKKT